MGIPGINITFSEKAVSTIKRGERGCIAMIVRDENTALQEKVIASIETIEDIPAWLNEKNQEQIKLAMLGYVNVPKQIIVYCIGLEDTYETALKYLETAKFDYLVIPTVQTDGKTLEIVSWIKGQREQRKHVKAILPNTEADSEGVINFVTETIYVGEKEYTTEQYCSRIAGVIAGTPLDISCTYAPLPEVTDCTRLNKNERKLAIEQGKLIIFHDGEKVKINSGVNSFVSTNKTKGNQFKKVKIVDIMDMISDDITRTIEDNYIGKYANSYDNKTLLLSALWSYFEELKNASILNTYDVEIDINANRLYLQSKGIETSSMNENDIKQAQTDDKVFLKAKLGILDAMEELELPIQI